MLPQTDLTYSLSSIISSIFIIYFLYILFVIMFKAHISSLQKVDNDLKEAERQLKILSTNALLLQKKKKEKWDNFFFKLK